MKTTSSLALTALLALVLTTVSIPATAQAGNSAQRARRLVAELRQDLRPLEDQIRKAAFLKALENGQVSQAQLRAFAGEQYQILINDLRSNAVMVARFGTEPTGIFFRGNLEGEVIARGMFLDFAAALGMSEADLLAYEPRPHGQTYGHYAATMAAYATNAQIAAAFLVNFPVFGENTGRMGAALRNRYGFTAEQTAFFDFFSGLPSTFEDEALAVIAAGLEKGAEPREIKRSARLLQAYEKDFWDAVGRN
jgi:thiaminase